MPEYLKKVFAYFKNNEIPRDILISVGSALTGALIFDRILRRDEEWAVNWGCYDLRKKLPLLWMWSCDLP